jgi:hypothetical protein
MKKHLTLIALFVLIVLIKSPCAMDYIFDKVFALQIAPPTSVLVDRNLNGPLQILNFMMENCMYHIEE